VPGALKDLLHQFFSLPVNNKKHVKHIVIKEKRELVGMRKCVLIRGALTASSQSFGGYSILSLINSNEGKCILLLSWIRDILFPVIRSFKDKPRPALHIEQKQVIKFTVLLKRKYEKAYNCTEQASYNFTAQNMKCVFIWNKLCIGEDPKKIDI
jgi:hypothetical protein